MQQPLNQEDKMSTEYSNLGNEAKAYLNLQIQLFKLNLVEKISQTISLIVTIMAGILLTLGALLYLSIIFVIQIANFTGSFSIGLLIIATIFLIILLLLILFKKRIIINPIIKTISAIIFNKKEEREEVTDEE